MCVTCFPLWLSAWCAAPWFRALCSAERRPERPTWRRTETTRLCRPSPSSRQSHGRSSPWKQTLDQSESRNKDTCRCLKDLVYWRRHRWTTYFPERSVTWTKVSLKEAKMWQTPNTFSPSATWGPRLMTCSSFFSFPLRGAIVWGGGRRRVQSVSSASSYWQTFKSRFSRSSCTLFFPDIYFCGDTSSIYTHETCLQQEPTSCLLHRAAESEGKTLNVYEAGKTWEPTTCCWVKVKIKHILFFL